MKRILLCASLLLLLFPLGVSAQDLVLSTDNVRFSASTFLEGRAVRMYATVGNPSDKDLRGVVRFFAGGDQIQGDQPISVLHGKDDSVFVDWTPFPGEHSIKIVVVPFENDEDDPANNTIVKSVTVYADSDRDGIPNHEDTDDDNDGIGDNQDAFPLNKKESVDSDGDGKGNNEDTDDDNDGVPDSEDQVPLNANETVDTDKDGLGNNEDTDDDGDGLLDTEEVTKKTDPLKPDTDGDAVNDKQDAYPLDPTQAHDFDRDGVSDSKDNDADNDGIAKPQDANDTNLGPAIEVTSFQGKARRLVAPGETVRFETTLSTDPDGGKIAGTKWKIDGQEKIGDMLETSFARNGFHTISVTVTDDEGESRETTFRVLVAPPALPWILVTAAFLLLILAIYLIFSYSKRA